jgi:hypothetical protein
MANTNLSLTAVCEQRKKLKSLSMALYLTLPPRLETKNPYLLYPQYKQRDFDMRRKAEILKYKKSSTQSNSALTVAQKWSKLVNPYTKSKNSYNNIILYQNDGSGNYFPIVVKWPDTYTISQSIIGYDVNENPIYMDVYNIIPGQRLRPCPSNIPTLSSSCGVPGPITTLYLDETVPLIYYNTNVNAYGIGNSSYTDPWTTVTKNNIFFSDSVNNLFMNLLINNSINNYAYTFTIKTPISVYFTATLNPDIPAGNIYLPNNSLSIQGVNIFTFYNGAQIVYQTTPTFSIDHEQDIRFDISFNSGFVSSTSYDSHGILIDNSYYNNTITGTFYIGTLTVSNLYLLTAASYIYDIDLNFTMNTSGMNSLFSSYFSTLTVGVNCNVDSNSKVDKNIIINNTGSYPLTQFLFSETK